MWTGSEALIELYAAVGRGCPGLPIVLQDHPASTQVRKHTKAARLAQQEKAHTPRLIQERAK